MKKNITLFWVLAILAIAFVAIFSSGNYGRILIFILIGITFAATLASIVSQCVRQRSGLIHSANAPIFALKLVAKFALLFLTSGTFIFILVFLKISEISESEGVSVFFSNTELFFRSLICSIDLFLLDVDSNIIDRVDAYPDLKTWVFIQAILSALTTVIFFLSLVVTRLRQLWVLNVNTRVSEKRNHLYIFFGLNKSTELLATDIRSNDPNAIIILVDKANIDSEKNDGFSNILSFLGHRPASFDFARKIKGVVAIANSSFEELEISEQNTDIFEIAGIPRLKRLIRSLASHKIPDPRLRLFFMGDKEDRNVNNILAIVKDKTLIETAPKIHTDIYCHARRSSHYSFLEELAIKSGFKINLVDSSYISIENLKQNEKYHPVNLVTLSRTNPATVSSSLNCLVIGFGEVGRDALRFLYEFGAFVDERSSASDSFRSPFRCVAIDSRMNDLAGGFIQSAPVLASSGSGVEFREVNSNDSKFTEEILTPQFSKNLNYVVIATGNDDENINLAIRIFRRCREYGNSMHQLRILVKCHQSEKYELMNKLAEFHNQSFDPSHPEQVIIIFGEPKSVFTYDLIIREKIEQEAKIFYAAYQKQSNGKKTWEERFKKLTLPPVSLDNLQTLRRQEGQDMENALHAKTKIYILENGLRYIYSADGDYNNEFFSKKMKDFLNRYFKPNGEANQTGSGDEITYPELTETENKIILNLAMLEHLRWNAAHELLGYSPCENDEKACDERRRIHPCLVAWQELDKISERATTPDWKADYKSFDFYVVDTTIALNRSDWQ